MGLVSGSGYLFSTSGRTEHPFLGRMVATALRLSFLATKCVWFQNPDDRDAFVREKLIPKDKCVVIRGGGIDVEEFNPDICTAELKARKRSELGIPIDSGIVLMVAARRIAAKGVREFAQAAAQVLPCRSNWRFLLIAPDDPGTPDNVHAEDAIFNVDGLVAPAGFRDDIRDIVAASDIVTLPSYYQEGLPRFLLEGMACGKPIVTTNHTGCRETVLPGENGFLVPIREHHALAEALARLMDDEQLRLSFGRCSRELCVREFSETLVCSRIIKEVYAL
ncbi:MAG: glycosyltransferase [Syntrophaceae bacterium]